MTNRLRVSSLSFLLLALSQTLQVGREGTKVLVSPPEERKSERQLGPWDCRANPPFSFPSLPFTFPPLPHLQSNFKQHHENNDDRILRLRVSIGSHVKTGYRLPSDWVPRIENTLFHSKRLQRKEKPLASARPPSRKGRISPARHPANPYRNVCAFGLEPQRPTEIEPNFTFPLPAFSPDSREKQRPLSTEIDFVVIVASHSRPFQHRSTFT